MNCVWKCLWECAECVITYLLIKFFWLIPSFVKNTVFLGTLYSYLLKTALDLFRKAETVNYDNIKIYHNEHGRTLNGTMNNLKCPLRGAAMQPILYNTPMHRVKWEDSPKVREEVLSLFKRNKQIEDDKANILAGAWIQFMIHDWFNTSEQVLEVNGKKYNHNTNDHWWSGSQLYGTELGREQIEDFKTHESMFLRDGDYLKVEKGYLPLDSSGEEIVGFNRNFWSGLGFLHYLFHLEHNYIVDRLKICKHDKDKIFDTARLIITAAIAKIHTIDWTTAIIQNRSARLTQYLIWHGLKGQLKLNTGISLINGLTSSYNNKDNFAHTAEFVSTYRMHSLLPDTINLRNHKTKELIGNAELSSLLLNKSSNINMTRSGQLDFLYTMGVQKACKLCLHNYPTTLQELAAIELTKDRKRGVPKYNELRRTLLLKPYKCFEEMTCDKQLLKDLKSAYPEGIDSMDNITGLHLEEKIPGNIFGETTYTVFTANTTKRIQRDRFLTECFTPEYYTDFGIEYVNMCSMSKILLRHFPEMSKHIKLDTNAFIPWDDKCAKKLYEEVSGFALIDCNFYLI